VANTGWAAGIRNDSFFRTNVGVFLPADPLPGQTINFELTISAADGSIAGSGSFAFSQAGVQQRSLESFGVGTLLDGSVSFRCDDPSVGWFAYASQVDQVTGDAVYRAALGRQTDLPAN
jgi:hypothetical protein